MILVDSSVWIQLLRGDDVASLSPPDWLRFATCGPIVQEVFQGLRSGRWNDDFREAFLTLPRLSDPVPVEIFLEAANIYSLGRKKGYKVRSTTKCLIAAVAIENRVPVWHRDRDFSLIARFTELQTVERQ